MLDSKKSAELEQSIAGVREAIPPLMRSMYAGFIENGFKESEALRLIGDYLHGLAQRRE